MQETVITVAKNISKYERNAGSFKNWLLHITRWRIADQFRKRSPGDLPRREPGDDSRRDTATIERIPDAIDLGEVWQQEWERHVLEVALQRLKRRLEPEQYQIFDCVALKGWPAAKVARELGVNIARVYLVKHRAASLLKKEIAAIRESQ